MQVPLVPVNEFTQVTLNDAKDAERWMQHFGATREQIEEAIRAVGNDVTAISEHLQHQGAGGGAS